MFNFQFFKSLTKPKPILRKISNPEEETLTPNNPLTYPVNNSMIAKRPAWIKLKRNNLTTGNNHYYRTINLQQERSRIRNVLFQNQDLKERLYDNILNSIPGDEQVIFASTYLRWYALFTFKLWKRRGLPPAKLPFKLNKYAGITPILSTSTKEYQKVGLAEILINTSRIKSIGLEEALLFSYYRDIRYAWVYSFTIGLFIWWVGTHDSLLAVPQAIFLAEEPEALTQMVNDTYIHHICSNHHTPSPCNLCNEPINSVVRDLIPNQPTLLPDLLTNAKKEALLKGLSTLIGTIFLTLMLNESISAHGVYFPL